MLKRAALHHRIARDAAVGRRLGELFPEELTEQLNRVRGETGIHHIYKFVLKPAALNGHGNGNGNGNGNGAHGKPHFREATVNIAIAPLVSKDGEQIGRLVRMFANHREDKEHQGDGAADQQGDRDESIAPILNGSRVGPVGLDQ